MSVVLEEEHQYTKKEILLSIIFIMLTALIIGAIVISLTNQPMGDAPPNPVKPHTSPAILRFLNAFSAL